jgi:hypothetical protein
MATRGQKPHVPDDKDRLLVKSLSAVGMPYEDISRKLKITSDTLVKYYKDELELGRADANAEIARTLYQQAKNGNVAAMMFWLKTRARWTEKHQHEISGIDGQPIVTRIERVIIDHTENTNATVG